MAQMVRLSEYAEMRGIVLARLRGLVRQNGAWLRARGRLRPDRLYEYDVEALDEFVARVCPKSGRRKNGVRPPDGMDAGAWCPFRPGDVVRVTNARGESRVGRITRVGESLGRMQLAGGESRVGRITRVGESLGRMQLAGGEETVFARDAQIEAADGPLSASDFGCSQGEETRLERWCRLVQPLADVGRKGRGKGRMRDK